MSDSDPSVPTRVRQYTIFVCPVPDCGNVMTTGRVEMHPLPEADEKWCYGSDAPGYPGSHEPTKCERIVVVPE